MWKTDRGQGLGTGSGAHKYQILLKFIRVKHIHTKVRPQEAGEKAPQSNFFQEREREIILVSSLQG